MDKFIADSIQLKRELIYWKVDLVGSIPISNIRKTKRLKENSS